MTKTTIFALISLQTTIFIKLPAIKAAFLKEEELNWSYYVFAKSDVAAAQFLLVKNKI